MDKKLKIFEFSAHSISVLSSMNSGLFLSKSLPAGGRQTGEGTKRRFSFYLFVLLLGPYLANAQGSLLVAWGIRWDVGE